MHLKQITDRNKTFVCAGDFNEAIGDDNDGTTKLLKN